MFIGGVHVSGCLLPAPLVDFECVCVCVCVCMDANTCVDAARRLHVPTDVDRPVDDVQDNERKGEHPPAYFIDSHCSVALLDEGVRLSG